MLLGLPVEVELQLRIELAIHGVAPEQGAKAVPQVVERLSHR
jgi:hypothetical protein